MNRNFSTLHYHNRMLFQYPIPPHIARNARALLPCSAGCLIGLWLDVGAVQPQSFFLHIKEGSCCCAPTLSTL